MIPSIDYLTLVIAGTILVYAGDAWEVREARSIKSAWVLMLGGAALFIIGTLRALMQVLGL